MIDNPKFVVVWRDKVMTLCNGVVFENESAAQEWAIKNVNHYAWQVLQLYTYRRVMIGAWEFVIYCLGYGALFKIILNTIGIG